MPTWEMRRKPNNIILIERRALPLDKNKQAADMPAQEDINAFARCLFPVILAYYNSAEGQKAFCQWQAEQQEKGKAKKEP